MGRRDSIQTSGAIEYQPIPPWRRRRGSGGGGIGIYPPSMATIPPDVFFNFTSNQAQIGTSVVPASPLLTTSRASAATVNDSAGNWVQVAANQARISNLGLLVEEARTNGVRNNSMQGVVFTTADNVELSTNGTFTPAGGAGWTQVITGTGSIDFSTPGQVKMTGDGGVLTTYIYQRLTGLTVGRGYVISIGAGGASFQISVGTTVGATDVLGRLQLNGNGTNNPTPDRVGFTATASTLFVQLERQTASLGACFGISVQDGERCENGAFSSSPVNAAQSTLQNGWQWSNNVGTGTVVYNGAGSGVTITGDGTHAARIGTIGLNTITGCLYTITADITVNAAAVEVSTAALNGGSAILNATSLVGTGQKFQFIAIGSLTFISFSKTSALASTINNISVQSAGSLPTNWATGGTMSGLTYNVVGFGTDSGINYIDVRLSGTALAADNPNLIFEASSIIAATYGQTWSASCFVSLPAGSMTGFTGGNVNLVLTEQGGSITQSPGFTPTNANLGSQRQVYTKTITASAVTFVKHQLQWGIANGVSVNGTFRIGWPQLENNNAVVATVASAAIAAGGSGGVAGSAVYSIGGGTFAIQATLNVTVSGGAITAINSVANPGNYSVFPPSPAALTYVSGTGSGVVGATVNLTPTNNATSAGATSPIVTSGAAATRAAEVVNLTSSLVFGSAVSLWAKGTPQLPTGFNNFQHLLSANDGTLNNMAIVDRQGALGFAIGQTISGGTTTNGPSTSVLWNQNASGKIALASAVNDQALSFNGGAVITTAVAQPIGLNNVSFGSRLDITREWNGFVEQAAIWKSQRLSNANLQAITT